MGAAKKYISLCILCLFTMHVNAQLLTGTGWGFNVGAVTALGNRFQRVGITLQGYYCYGHAQGNAEVRFYRNFRNLGPRGQYNELVTSAGLLVGYGQMQTEDNPFLSTIGNQTGYKNSIGYAYHLYLTKIGTTQRTATIALQFDDFSLITENDIFARSTLDRFRTGGILLQYQYRNQYQFGINCTMWTGEMGTNKITTDKGFPFRGYMDTTGGVYTNYSHGLLSGQFKMLLPASQNLQANVGIDAEQVRNFMQNRLIHDAVLSHNPQNCHIPMLDTAGNPYLYRPGQRIKEPHPYWNVFTGAAGFY